LCQQSIALKDDPGTSEQMYSLVNRTTGAVEARLPTMPDALMAMTRLQGQLNEARANGSGILEFYDKDTVN
jgi:hypothetical protein